MKVVIIGSGNVANALGSRMVAAGHVVLEVVGRNEAAVAQLANELNALPVTNINRTTGLADLYLIAVSDKAIHAMADELRVHDKLVVHTAAAVPSTVLHACSAHYGVIYPLQTLTKAATGADPLTLLITGESGTTVAALRSFCEAWATQILAATDEERLKLHLAAVFVNNFTNHLIALAADYCKANQLDFNLLQPLIGSTFRRIQHAHAADVQTGPAIRGDGETMHKHLTLLANHPQMRKLYEALSSSIQHFYQEK